MKKFIYSMFLVLATSLVACTEDYKDWVQPQQNEQPEIVTFGNGSVSAVGLIDFAAIAEGQTLVKVCNITAPTASSEDYKTMLYELHLSTGASSYISNNGEVGTEFLQTEVEQKFGKAPEERTLIGYVEQWISNGETTIKTATSAEFEIKAKLAAPDIAQAYYLVGDMCGWSEDTMIKFSHSDNNVYDDPVFTINFETTADNQYWKIIPQTNVDAGNIWQDGVLGVEIDGDTSTEGLLVNVSPGAGKIEAAGKYRMTIDMMNYTYRIEAVNYDPFIYFIGATDGWSASEQKLALVDDATGTYTGFLYCADPNGWGNQFKFQRVPGDWGTELNTGHFTTFSGAATDCGGNIGVSGGENVYYFSVSLGNGEIYAEEVTKMGIIGDFNGWSGDLEMTWNAADYCYEASISEVTANGWKFRINGDWAVNLGGDSLSDLVANGSNLFVEGTTCKLYPTRKTSDHIYCVVE